MRPVGEVRAALLHALRSGAVGTFDALAAHAGVEPERAQTTLGHLCREGGVVVKATHQPEARRGRPRAVYALADAAPPPSSRWALDRTLCAAWR